MEVFSGNGAECMARFIKEGCRGAIYREDVHVQVVFINQPIWEDDGDDCRWALSWLKSPCTYYPPEPIYRDATPGEALDAWFRGMTVQRRADTLDDAIADGEWYDIGPRYSDMPFSRWSVQETKYRIKED